MRLTRCLLLVFATSWFSIAGAATFVVNSTVDAVDANPGDSKCRTVDKECTLRAATMEANALAGHDTIEVPPGRYLLTLPSESPFDRVDWAGSLLLTDHITIAGAAAELTIIDVTPLNDRAVWAPGTRSNPDPLRVELVGLTITGGTAGCVRHEGNGTLTVSKSVITECEAGSGGGGGILHLGSGQVGLVKVIDSTVSNCSASFGGGISNINGDLVLIRSVITNNSALGPSQSSAQWGGGINVPVGSLVAIDSVISNNVAGRSGGGIRASQSTIYLERTTVSGNQSLHVTGAEGPMEGNGGGIWVERVRLHVVNSTISNNTAVNQGAGIYSQRDAAYHLAFSTIADNRNEKGLAGAGMTMVSPQNVREPLYQTTRGTIIARNTTAGSASDCVIDAPVESQGFNIDSDGTCGLVHWTDRPSIGADLGPLADNGGPNETHALMAGSAAIDLVPNEECVLAIDNDWDYRVDEDPVDGIDNDGDGRVDEDPEDFLDIDQRGIDRPIGVACDSGAFEAGVTAEIAIEALIVDVEELIDDGEIAYGRGRSLMAELQVALWFLEFRGGERIAIMRIELFIIKVERLIDKGDLDPEIGAELLAKARSIIELLQ